MQTHQIENMSASEIKSQRDAIITELTRHYEQSSDELAERYVQARLDAKLRDEKLAEQGQTIMTLNASLELAQREVARLSELLDAANRHQLAIAQRAADNDKIAAASMGAMQTEINDLRQELQDAVARGDRLKSCATRNQSAISGAAKLLNDALSAQQIETADQV